MNTFVKDNWFKLSILLVIIVLIIGWFYWYSLRPNIVKKDCFNRAIEKAREKGKLRGFTNENFNEGDYDAYYKICLQESGL